MLFKIPNTDYQICKICKDCKNIIREKKFLQSRFVCLFFSGFASSLLKYKICESFLVLEQNSSISQSIRNFFRVVSFYFSSSESSILKFFILRARKFHFLKYKSSIFLKYKKSFFLRKYKFFQCFFF